jgi:hypothetical protein
MKWIQLINDCRGLKVTQEELSTASIGSMFPIKYCLDTKDISEKNWATCILKKVSMQGIFEIKNLVDIEKKNKTLEWGGDDGLCNMWDLYFKNPTFDELDEVARDVNVGVAWELFQGDNIGEGVRENDDSESFDSAAEDREQKEEEEANDIIDLDGQKNVFSINDDLAYSRRDHDEYQKALSCGSMLAYNYWWPLGFPGIPESFQFVITCHHQLFCYVH